MELLLAATAQTFRRGDSLVVVAGPGPKDIYLSRDGNPRFDQLFELLGSSSWRTSDMAAFGCVCVLPGEPPTRYHLQRAGEVLTVNGEEYHLIEQPLQEINYQPVPARIEFEFLCRSGDSYLYSFRRYNTEDGSCFVEAYKGRPGHMVRVEEEGSGYVLVGDDVWLIGEDPPSGWLPLDPWLFRFTWSESAGEGVLVERPTCV